MDILVTYDINTENRADERRLAKIAAVCERYGHRAQYSVFECRLSESRILRLIAELTDLIDPDVDSINIYKLSGTIDTTRMSLGVTHRPCQFGKPWIL